MIRLALLRWPTCTPSRSLGPYDSHAYCRAAPGDLAAHDPGRALLRARRILHRPGGTGPARRRHARPRRPRPAGQRRVLATPETIAIMRQRYGARPAARCRRSAMARHCRSARCGYASCPPAMCWAAPRSSSSTAAAGSSFPATTSAARTRPAPPSSRNLRSVHHRGDVRVAGVSPSARQPRDREAVAFAAAVSRALPLVGVYALGKCQRVIALLRGPDTTSRSICTARCSA